VRGKLIAIWSTKTILLLVPEFKAPVSFLLYPSILSPLPFLCSLSIPLFVFHYYYLLTLITHKNLCAPRLRYEFVYALREVIERAATQVLQLDGNSISPIVMTNGWDVDLLICNIPMPQSLLRRKEIL